VEQDSLDILRKNRHKRVEPDTPAARVVHMLRAFHNLQEECSEEVVGLAGASIACSWVVQGVGGDLEAIHKVVEVLYWS
jgi:hypothetical protein